MWHCEISRVGQLNYDPTTCSYGEILILVATINRDLVRLLGKKSPDMSFDLVLYKFCFLL